MSLTPLALGEHHSTLHLNTGTPKFSFVWVFFCCFGRCQQKQNWKHLQWQLISSTPFNKTKGREKEWGYKKSGALSLAVTYMHRGRSVGESERDEQEGSLQQQNYKRLHTNSKIQQPGSWAQRRQQVQTHGTVVVAVGRLLTNVYSRLCGMMCEIMHWTGDFWHHIKKSCRRPHTLWPF